MSSEFVETAVFDVATLRLLFAFLSQSTEADHAAELTAEAGPVSRSAAVLLGGGRHGDQSTRNQWIQESHPDSGASRAGPWAARGHNGHGAQTR